MKIHLFKNGGKALIDDKTVIKITVEENGLGPIDIIEGHFDNIKTHFPGLKMTDIVMPRKK